MPKLTGAVVTEEPFSQFADHGATAIAAPAGHLIDRRANCVRLAIQLT
jgi:hypothetical protein